MATQIAYNYAGCYVGSVDLYGFVPQNDFITFEVTVSDCQRSGLENQSDGFWFLVGDTLPNPINCFLDAGVPLTPCTPNLSLANWRDAVHSFYLNETKTFRNTTPFVPGQQYNIMFGYGAGTECNYQVKIIEGSTAIPNLSEPEILGEKEICVGSTVTYRPQTEAIGTFYTVTLNGDTINTEARTAITWDEVGTYELCIETINHCSQPEATCVDIIVTRPDTVEQTVFLCPGDCYDISAIERVCTPGSYVTSATASDGCDSTTMFTVIAAETDTTLLLVNLCLGDTLNYQEQLYFTEGTFESTLLNRAGCDSMILLDVIIRNCPLNSRIESRDVLCNGDITGQLTFSLESGNPPYSYRWERLGSAPGGFGTVAEQGSQTTITGLPIGTYIIEIEDRFGNEGFLNATIRQPDELAVQLLPTDYNGFAVSCSVGQDGRLTSEPVGGVLPYRYRWSNGAMTNSIENLNPGSYTLTVTDANGCEYEQIAMLNAPPPLIVDVTVIDENCDSASTGSIEIDQISGGVSPYAVEIATDAGNLIDRYKNLPAGSYVLDITDANNCSTSSPLTIETSLRPLGALFVSDDRIELGSSVQIDLSNLENTSENHILLGNDTLCINCTTLTLEAINSDTIFAHLISSDGCELMLQQHLTVIKNRKVYIPNAFSPNADGTNDVLRLHPGISAHTVKHITVYDRWGGLIHEVNDPIEIITGSAVDLWTGTTNGKSVGTGLYFWVVEVEFLDGYNQILKGTVMLTR